jgi:hypothetical protein
MPKLIDTATAAQIRADLKASTTGFFEQQVAAVARAIETLLGALEAEPEPPVVESKAKTTKKK